MLTKYSPTNTECAHLKWFLTIRRWSSYMLILISLLISPSDLHSEGGFHRHLSTHHRREGELPKLFKRKFVEYHQVPDQRTRLCRFVCFAQTSKPSNPWRLGKGSREQDVHVTHSDQLLSAAHPVSRNTKKLIAQVCLHIVCGSYCALCSFEKWFKHEYKQREA